MNHNELCILLIGLFSGTAIANDEERLIVNIENVQEPFGKINATLFDSEENHLKKSFQEIVIDVKPDHTAQGSFAKIPAGFYSVVITHDVNANDKIDTNFLGIPTEPYAFSNNIKPGFGAPDFNETNFEYRSGKLTITIKFPDKVEAVEFIKVR